MNAVRQDDLLALAQQLNERELAILDIVERFRLVQSSQVERLFFYEQARSEAAGRHCRRQLGRLVELRLLRRLDRRVGGVRAGSAGYVYALAPAGRRVHALTRDADAPSNRGVHEPGLAFVTHTLAIGDLYVRLRDDERTKDIELLQFQTEPDCWRPYTLPTAAPGYVKPDALVRLGVGEWEERSFVEVDLGTEGRGALTRKIRAYLAYYRSGREQAAHGVFPRVAFLTTTEARARQIAAVAEQAGAESGLVVTATITDATDVLTGLEAVA